MKVFYLTNGGSIHDHRFLMKLVESGIEVEYAYLVRAGAKNAIAGVSAHHLEYERVMKLPGWAKWPGRLMVLRRLTRLLDETKPDVLHAGYLSSVGFLAAASRYRPFLLMPWGSDVLLFPHRGWLPRQIARFVIRRADLISTDCYESAREVAALSGRVRKPVVVMPRGVDRRLFRPDAELGVAMRRERNWGERPLVLSNRSFEPLYAVDDFIRSLQSLVYRVPDARALIIGGGSQERELHKLSRDLGLADSVEFIGVVEHKDLPAYLNAADVYVSASLSDGTSNSLLEAFACGLPVVVTDIPSNQEWVTDGVNGRVVPRQDPSKLGQALANLLTDSTLRRKMSRLNLAAAETRCDWDRNFLKLLGAYEVLVSSAPPRANVSIRH